MSPDRTAERLHERRTPAAVLWDMDGTLVDTEPTWADVTRELVRTQGHGRWTDQDSEAMIGNDLEVSARLVQERGGVTLPVAEIVEMLNTSVVQRMQEALPWRPGARELLADVRAHHVPCALVTMSYERLTRPVLDALPPRSFDVVVTGDTVSRGKPHPEPYLHAARLLGVAPKDCVAIEDSNTGATSAEAAGCVVVVVQHQVEVAAGERRVFLDGLAGVGVEDLARLTSDGC